ncbi:MAG: fatty acid desaturase [Gammaproteobacteria bacterium]
MNEQFEHRALIEISTLRQLQARRDLPSVVRLTVHLASFVLLCIAVPLVHEQALLAAACAIALAWVWSGLFAPFHECTHRTAFRTSAANRIGAWLTGVPFMMAPAVYRTFHFEHHRHTQDPDKDPELMNDPRYAAWPGDRRGWLIMASGWGLLQLKLRPLFGFAFKPRSEWETFARWAPRIEDPAGLVRECRIVLALWLVFVVAALFIIPGGWWLLFAAWFAHVFQVLWIASEHTGLPLEGGILVRTRTVASNPFVRFWLWNMNYHAEHHAWPGIPWHQLPATHALVATELGSFVPGYGALHRNVLSGRNRPTADPADNFAEA